MQDELTHYLQCSIAIKKSKEKILKDFGYNTYKAFDEAWENIKGAIPPNGVGADGYRLFNVTKYSYAIQGGKPIASSSKPKLVKE